MVYIESMFRVLPQPVEDAAVDGGAAGEGIRASECTPIGVQASEIIESILHDKSPGLAEVHWRLRRCLAAHPGSPERALLAHLMETTELSNHGTG